MEIYGVWMEYERVDDKKIQTMVEEWDGIE